jgi:triosephosphate isomerase (TIM)
MRKAIVAGNWKMFKTVAQATEFANALKAVPDFLTDANRAEVVVCPPYIDIPAVRDALQGTPIKTGAQNVHHLKEGAYTGCISAGMLQGYVEYVILGHSEVRRDLGETDARVNEKAKLLLESGLKPIIAVGELLSQREAGETEALIETQVRAALDGLPADSITDVVIAYEPIWAIGTGKACDPDEANRVIGLIRGHVAALYGNNGAQALRIQYGGSVNMGNMATYMAQPEIDGALVGGASLKVDDFVKLVRDAIQAKGA